MSNPHNFTFWKLSGETKKCIIFLFVVFFSLFSESCRRSCQWITKYGTFEVDSQIHVKLEVLLVIIGYCLNIKQSFLNVQNHSYIFRMNCQNLEVEFLVSQNIIIISVVYKILTSKQCFLNVFWLAQEYNILKQCTQLFCVLSKSHFR